MPKTDLGERMDGFVRWQAITITQLTTAINILLGFAGAALAFGTNLFVKEEFALRGCPRWLFLASLAVLLISMALGGWCTVNRLRDFRATTEAARKRELGAPDAEVKPLRDLYDRLGIRTWAIFWWQLGTFFGGVALMIISMAAYEWVRHKNFPLAL